MALCAIAFRISDLEIRISFLRSKKAMAVPKKKTTRKRKGDRRAHQGLEVLALNKCTQCGSAKLPHRVCLECGFYQGRQILAIKTRKEKGRQKEKGEARGPKKLGRRPEHAAVEPVKTGIKEPAGQPLSLEALSRRPTGDR
jgi:large subunit ribosomal protein L32